jgi:putative DNA primase/helicase
MTPDAPIERSGDASPRDVLLAAIAGAPVIVGEGAAAADGGADGARSGREKDAANPSATPRGAPNTPTAPLNSDEALALAFADEHAERLRYVATWGQWLSFDGKRWRADDTLFGLDEARKVCRRAAQACDGPKTAKELASAKTVAAVERLAKADRRLAATTDVWDRDLFLLNTPKGVVDLHDGTMRAHDPRDLITKSTSVAPHGDCPRFLRFLDEITHGDAALVEYLRRVAGYALTGATTEHALFFAFGTGANGKSVFLNTLAGVLGDYHRTAPIETFINSLGDRHPTELARLRGARFVTATETEEGRRWAESKVKALTGGDRITARFMRQDFFEFEPHFKLFMAGNHKPGLRSVDESIRRRFHLVPFAVTIPVEDRDQRLAEALRDEWPGVLAWAIEGCLAWQETGLSVPECVRIATSDYLAAEDSVATWIEDRCDVGPNESDTSANLFTSWASWANKAGEYVGSRKRLAQSLEAKGFFPARDASARKFNGLRVHTESQEETAPAYSDVDEGDR